MWHIVAAAGKLLASSAWLHGLSSSFSVWGLCTYMGSQLHARGCRPKTPAYCVQVWKALVSDVLNYALPLRSRADVQSVRGAWPAMAAAKKGTQSYGLASLLLQFWFGVYVTHPGYYPDPAMEFMHLINAGSLEELSRSSLGATNGQNCRPSCSLDCVQCAITCPPSKPCCLH